MTGERVDARRAYGSGEPPDGYTLRSAGAALVIFDVLHGDRKGGWLFAVEERDEQALAIADALMDGQQMVALVRGDDGQVEVLRMEVAAVTKLSRIAQPGQSPATFSSFYRLSPPAAEEPR